MTVMPNISASGTGTITALEPVARSPHWHRSIPWIVLSAGLMFAAVSTLYVRSYVDKISELDFNAHCDEIRSIIANRLDDHARILRSGAALFNAEGDMVTREKWRVFTQTQRLERSCLSSLWV